MTPAARGAQSRVEFDATAGTVYWIRVDGYFDAAGDIQLSWGCWPRNFRIGRVHNFVLNSWDSVGFSLQGTPELRDGGSVWTDIPGASPVLLPATGSARFFRLRCEKYGRRAARPRHQRSRGQPPDHTEVFAANSCEVLEGWRHRGHAAVCCGSTTRRATSAWPILSWANPAGNPLFSSPPATAIITSRISPLTACARATVPSSHRRQGGLLPARPDALESHRQRHGHLHLRLPGHPGRLGRYLFRRLPCQYIDITDVRAG
jgi:hypothetical protein